MKKILISLLVLLPVIALAQPFPSAQDKYVNDFAGFLGDITQLRSMLALLEENTTAEVVVVTVQTTEPLAPSQYRTELFNEWKIGKENDNGLLILYAVKEKRIEVEVGYGLEGILPDSKVGRILDDYYVPYRDSNQTVKGILTAAEELARVISENKEEVIYISDKEVFVTIMATVMPVIIMFIIFTIIILNSQFSRPKCKECGKQMKFHKYEKDFVVYKCENGHILKKKRRHRAVVFIGGGGFGGFGGGGFGGGGSGGGGVGR